VRLRSVGGAYGGKLNAHLPTAVLASLACRKHNVPVRLHAERSDDMTATGGRAAMQGNFRLAVTPDGIVSSLELFAAWESGVTDGGAGDVAMGVSWSDSAYRAADFAAHGSFSNTATPGNTACRAPGVVQSIPLHEVTFILIYMSIYTYIDR